MALGLETGDASLVRDRTTATQLRAFFGKPDADHTGGVDRLREQLDARGMPDAVRERGRGVLARLSGLLPTDPEHGREREYLRCLASLPWTKRTAGRLDLARARLRRAPAAVEGMGVALGHSLMIARELEQGTLVSLFDSRVTAPDRYLLVTAPASIGKPQVRAFRDWVLQQSKGRSPNEQIGEASGVPPAGGTAPDVDPGEGKRRKGRRR